jgi:hypothetical protein
MYIDTREVNFIAFNNITKYDFLTDVDIHIYPILKSIDNT